MGCARRPWLNSGPKLGGGWGEKKNKPISESKAIMSLGPLTDEKAAFRQRYLKLANALNMYNRTYGEAIKKRSRRRSTAGRILRIFAQDSAEAGLSPCRGQYWLRL